MNSRWQNALLLFGVILLVVWPLLTVQLQVGSGGNPAAVFTGVDDQAAGVIRQLAPDYRPWTAPLMVPPSGEIESLLFTLQAVLGAGFIGYYCGVKRERARRGDPTGASRAD